MDSIVPRIKDIDIDREMRDAYLQYSMSVIVGRALPDVRDGLKPVHRRVLFAMHELSNYHNKPYKKSARIVGDVIGKYHPHGDVAVYDTMVRMAQDFSLRYPLIDGQGNFGSIDGDAPAAQRYTEVRMTELAEALLEDIDKDTVNFGPNYDDSLTIPLVLPAKFPNLLVNGSAGIAVGMATNIPPHNLNEVINATLALIEDSTVADETLMDLVPGPDFPSYGIIVGRSGIRSAYKTGRGIITIKAVAEVVTQKDREEIIVSEIPYQVNKARLIESMANLVREKKVEGISDIRDESSREGMRIVIQVKRNENAQVILNRLYKFTQLQVSFGINMLALDAQNQPRLFGLRAMLTSFIDHRRDVVTRRCIFELKKAEARAHILEGLKKALDRIDQVIQLIRGSKDAEVARQDLIAEIGFSEKQAQAILEMRLQRLTGLERAKLEAELKEITEKIAWLRRVLGDPQEILKIISAELKDIQQKFGDKRRTRIESAEGEMSDEDLIANEEMVVSLTFGGYIKRIPIDEYRLQKRGGKGLKGSGARDEDFVYKIFTASTHTTLLMISDRGRLYWAKVHELPLASRTSRGKAIANVIRLASGEKIQTVIPVVEFDDTCGLTMVTAKGIIKKSALSLFSKPRSAGLIALTIDLDDNLMDSCVVGAEDHIFLVTRQGMSIRFQSSDVRSMGRGARGVKAVTLGEDDKVIGLDVIPKNCTTFSLILTENGFGKRTAFEEYRVQSRGGVGLITQKVTDRVGPVVAALNVTETDQIIVTTNQGQAIRMKVADIPVIGRNTQGVKLITLKTGERVTGMAILADDENSEEDNSSLH